MEEIKNKVAQSKLITIDLEDYYPQGNRIVFDIKNWLFEGVILKEKDFREHVKNHDWSQYKNSFIALTCTVDAVIPSWAYLLITAQMAPFAKRIIVGNLDQLETAVYQEIIAGLSLEEFKNKPIIIKGCSNKPIPETAYTQLIAKLVPVARSIMYGEACSTVPLFKVKKILLALTLMLTSAFAFSQEKTDSIPDGWRTSGKITLLINQHFQTGNQEVITISRET